MRRQFVLLPVGVVWALAFAGCGGAAQSSLGDAGVANQLNDSGGSSPDSSGSTSEGGSSFDPGSIVGGLLGGASDAGMMIMDGGTSGDPGPDAAPPMSLPPQQIMDGCSQLCTKEATAACPAQGTADSCLLGCRLLAGNPACSTETANLFSCGMNATASCDAAGKAQLDGCGIQQLNFASCLLTKSSDPSLSGPCANYCAGVAAAKCPNDKPGDCQASCPLLGGLLGCSAPWKSYVTCGEHEMFTCGTDGKASASACIGPALGFFACVYTKLSSDAGK
jgi:hypothetical protein